MRRAMAAVNPLIPAPTTNISKGLVTTSLAPVLIEFAMVRNFSL